MENETKQKYRFDKLKLNNLVNRVETTMLQKEMAIMHVMHLHSEIGRYFSLTQCTQNKQWKITEHKTIRTLSPFSFLLFGLLKMLEISIRKCHGLSNVCPFETFIANHKRILQRWTTGSWPLFTAFENFPLIRCQKKKKFHLCWSAEFGFSWMCHCHSCFNCAKSFYVVACGWGFSNAIILAYEPKKKPRNPNNIMAKFLPNFQ